MEGAQGGQRLVIGLPIVKKQPHDGVRGALFGEGFRIPDGVRGEQDGAVVDGLDECAVLAGGVAGRLPEICQKPCWRSTERQTL